MNHTNRTAIGIALLVFSVALPGQQKPAGDKTQGPELKELMARLVETEKSLKSVVMELTTKDEFPNGVKFQTKAVLRVLGKTHYHVRVEAQFGDGFRSEKETVVTPEGCFRHQRDAREDIYLRMKASLVEELQKKTKAISEDQNSKRLALPGPGTAAGPAPLGSAMLLALNHNFALKLGKKEILDKVPCVVVTGDSREAGKSEQEQNAPASRIPVKVVIYCREKDGIPIKMTQFNRKGDALLRFAVQKLELEPKLLPASFKLEKPDDVPYTDFEKHPPSWAQIVRIREAYDAKLEADERAKEEEAKKKDDGK